MPAVGWLQFGTRSECAHVCGRDLPGAESRPGARERGGPGGSVRSRRPGECGPGAPGHQPGPWAGPKPGGEAAED